MKINVKNQILDSRNTLNLKQDKYKYNTVQVLKTKNEEENLKTSQKKRRKITTKGITIRLITDFPVQEMEARRYEIILLQFWKKLAAKLDFSTQ